MNKIQSAFAYLLNLLSGMYGTGWEISDAFEDAAIEFGLDNKESVQLKELYQRMNNNF